MAISRVQKVVDTRESGVGSASVQLTGVAAGNLLVLTSAVFNSSGGGVVVTGGGDWEQAANINGDASSQIYIHFCLAATGGTTTVTCDPNGASADIDLTLSEYSSPLRLVRDKSVTNSGTFTRSVGASPLVVSGVLARADELIVAIMSSTGQDGVALTPDGTYTEIGENQDNSGGQCYNAQDKLVSTTASDQADWTIAAGTGPDTDTWFCALATFCARFEICSRRGELTLNVARQPEQPFFVPQ